MLPYLKFLLDRINRFLPEAALESIIRNQGVRKQKELEQACFSPIFGDLIPLTRIDIALDLNAGYI